MKKLICTIFSLTDSELKQSTKKIHSRPTQGFIDSTYYDNYLLDFNQKKLSVKYIDRSNIIYGFPDWLGQPRCPLDIDLLPEDQVTVWCSQAAPFSNDTYKVKPVWEQLN